MQFSYDGIMYMQLVSFIVVLVTTLVEVQVHVCQHPEALKQRTALTAITNCPFSKKLCR